MKIVILDSTTANPGDLSWDFLKKYGDLTVYDRTPPSMVPSRGRGADILIINKTVISRESIEQMPGVKLIALLATGYNVVDCEAAAAHGILVANIPSYSESAVAQQTFAFILEYANRVGIHADMVRSGAWTHCNDFSFTAAPLTELAGKTLGVIGFGRIGRRVARIAEGFDMNVLVNTAHPEKYAEYPYRFLPLDTLLPQCDFVSIHCPMTPATAKMVNADFLSKMKDGAFLVNNARGGEVDEAAVASALKSGKLGGMGADVLSTEPPMADNPLLSAPNVYITPHIAWAGRETRVRLMGILEQNIAAFINGAPQNIVNASC